MTTTSEFVRIKIGDAPKTGLHAKGSITYAVLRDTAASEAYFLLLGNDSGGYFSREAISFGAIRRCLADSNPDKPIPAKRFKDAFVGRSANNSGFLVACLRQEGLLQPAPNAAHIHCLAAEEEWERWKSAVLQESGTSFEWPVTSKASSASSITVEEIPHQPKSKLRQKNPDTKSRHPTSGQEESPDASAS